ncbi:unnamed protein product [Soboliphyme baturini]|uniref:Secreted protein n=1 Tax=Soboliphyme baturini TaxID=241478 RepID=A0A183IEB5_9BILA|nr:unnamed protein product [Soboliphyme baturini]
MRSSHKMQLICRPARDSALSSRITAKMEVVLVAVELLAHFLCTTVQLETSFRGHKAFCHDNGPDTAPTARRFQSLSKKSGTKKRHALIITFAPEYNL